MSDFIPRFLLPNFYFLLSAFRVPERLKNKHFPVNPEK